MTHSKESASNAGELGSTLDGEDPLEKGIPTPVFFPGESHGYRSLEGWLQSMGLQRVNTTE